MTRHDVLMHATQSDRRPAATPAHEPAPFIYRSFGLHFATPFACPELAPAPATEAPDVVVRFGDVPAALPDAAVQGPAFQATANELLLAIPLVARYLVRAGREIVIEPAPGVEDDALRLFLLGSCVAALLQQRGLLTLHASAVRFERGAVLLLGDSGAGKSTLAAALARRGGEVVTDDVAAIVPDGGVPRVLPATTQVKLWADAAERLAEDVASLRRVRSGIDKYALPVTRALDAPAVVRHAYVLEPHEDRGVRFEPLDAAARFVALTRYTYRPRFLDPVVRRPEHFRLAAATAARIPVTNVRRPETSFLLDELADRILADIA